MSHVNLFSAGHTSDEVRSALEQHQRRDGRWIGFYDLVMGGCVAYLLRDTEPLTFIAGLTAVLMAITGMRYFIDQSNRNFYLHRLDWERSLEGERVERERDAMREMWERERGDDK
ncbi:MAG: hypothetical protein EOP21_07945 [Hyphomicrobiales bacterium]|nr:MAG: hypothetical protein EOP21_07945 [Hyphomicrobiales bacterium]